MRTDIDLGSAVVVLNDLTIAATGDLDVTAANNWQITVGRNWTRALGGAFQAQQGTVVFDDNPSTVNGALTTGDAAGETFYVLRINEAGGTFTFGSPLTIVKEIDIASGALAEGAGTQSITMGTAASPNAAAPPTGADTQYVVWKNQVGENGFQAGDGSVVFAVAAPHAYRLYGRSVFRDFIATTPGSQLYFQDNTVGAYTAYPGGTENATIVTGLFHVEGVSGNPITLDNISGVAAVGCAAAPHVRQWVLVLTGTVTVDWVTVANGWSPASIAPGPNSVDGGNNCRWQFGVPILASWTLDTDGNGRIDRIRVQVEVATQLSDSFGTLTVAVSGYAVTGYGTAAGANDDVFDILLQEGTSLDTGSRPTWQLLVNAQPGGLRNQVGGGAYVHAGTDVYTADDGARPIFAYTLAVANERRAYLRFSERVWTDAAATTRIAAGDFAYSDAGNPFTLTALTLVSEGTIDAMLLFTNPITEADVFLPRTVTAAANAVYDQGYTVDPGTYPNTNLDGNLPSAAKPMAAAAHRISDVGLGLINPVWASDQVTDRDPIRGGIGRITVFNGSGWLQDTDVLLQSRTEGPGPYPAVDLYFDVDAPKLDGLWLPVVTATDRGHVANAAARVVNGTPVGVTALTDFVIPENDAEIRDDADLEFLFVIGGLPCAYVSDRSDPRTARPWGWAVRGIRTQRGSVTIMNNVINPERGERTSLHYVLTGGGTVTITVFDLKGDIVDILYRGQQTAGEHSTTWDGRNRAGNAVARGVYFVKLVGPGVSETRKVMVVK